MANGIRRWADRFKWVTAVPGLIQCGSSTASQSFEGNPMIQLYGTCSDTTGTRRMMVIDQTMTGASTSNYVEALRVDVTSNVRTGAWCNAIMSQIDYSTAGFPHGMAATICAEMVPPNGSLTRGALYALDLEFGCGASSSWGSAGPVAFWKMENWGTATYFDDAAYMFHLAGCTSATGHLLYTNSIKVRIGTSTKYLPYGDAEQGLHLGTNGSKNTLVASAPYMSIYDTTSATSGSLRSMYISQTHTAAATTSQTEALKVLITSDVKTGAWCNAITAALDYSTNGAAHGEAGPLYAELTVPNSSLERGELYGLGIGIGVGASSSWASAGPVSFIKFDTWGTVLHFEENGYLFHLSGIGDATAGEIFDTCTAGAASHALKILIGSTPYYIMLQDNVDA